MWKTEEAKCVIDLSQSITNIKEVGESKRIHDVIVYHDHICFCIPWNHLIMFYWEIYTFNSLVLKKIHIVALQLYVVLSLLGL